MFNMWNGDRRDRNGKKPYCLSFELHWVHAGDYVYHRFSTLDHLSNIAKNKANNFKVHILLLIRSQ